MDRDKESQAFENLPKIFFNKPFILQPDFNKPFFLNTNASTFAFSDVLMQQSNGTSLQKVFEELRRDTFLLI